MMRYVDQITITKEIDIGTNRTLIKERINAGNITRMKITNLSNAGPAITGTTARSARCFDQSDNKKKQKAKRKMKLRV